MKIKEIIVKVKNKIGYLYKVNKKLFFVSFIFILFMIVGLIYPITQRKMKDEKAAETIHIVQNDMLVYTESLEQKIRQMLLRLSFISDVRVMVIAEATPTYQYLIEKETSTVKDEKGENFIVKEEVVFDKTSSSQSPILVSVLFPKIKGVLISLNKIDSSTKISIQNAVAGVLNIEVNSIFILQDK